jgi:hypothetical protein
MNTHRFRNDFKTKESDLNENIEDEWCVNRSRILKPDIKLSSKAHREWFGLN